MVLWSNSDPWVGCRVFLFISPGLNPSLLFFPVGQDEPSSLEVTWPDGRVISRSIASSEINSVLEIPYPRDTPGSPLTILPLEVSPAFASHAHVT